MSEPKPHTAAQELDAWLVSNKRIVSNICNSRIIDKQTAEYYLQLAFYAGYKAGEGKYLLHTGRPGNAGNASNIPAQ